MLFKRYYMYDIFIEKYANIAIYFLNNNETMLCIVKDANNISKNTVQSILSDYFDQQDYCLKFLNEELIYQIKKEIKYILNDFNIKCDIEILN